MRKKHIYALIIFALLVVPFIIHCIFKIHPNLSFFIPEWTAGDVLTSYFSLFGAIATVVAVYSTIKYNKQENRNDKILSIRPYISSRYIYDKTYLKSTELTKSEYIIFYSNNDIPLCYPSNNNISHSDVYGDFCCFKYILKNVGLGTAINIVLYNEDNPIFQINDVQKGEEFIFEIYVVYNIEDKKKNYTFNIKLAYNDLLDNNYFQTEKFVISLLSDGSQGYVQMNPLSLPKQQSK